MCVPRGSRGTETVAVGTASSLVTNAYDHAEHLERDDLGRITRIDETVAVVTTSREYRYDAAGRLDSVGVVGVPTASRVYEYDGLGAGNGNRTRVRYGTGVVDTASYDAQDRLLAYGESAYDWSPAGDLMQRNRPGERFTTTYDALGNLIEAESLPMVNGVETPGVSRATTVHYKVDGQGRRVERAMTFEGATTTQRWLYRDGLSVVAELDSADAVVNRYVYASMDHSSDLMVRGGVTYRAITDHLGSVRALVSVTNGAVLQTITYDAWGEETSNSAPAVQSLGYAGGLTDAETKLIRFGARDYEPGVGRWTGADPLGFEGGDTNLRAYVESDPLNAVDPSGLSRYREETVGQCMERMAEMRYGGWLGVSDGLGYYGVLASLGSVAGGKTLARALAQDGALALFERVLEHLKFYYALLAVHRGGSLGARPVVAEQGAKVAALLGPAHKMVSTFNKVSMPLGVGATSLSVLARVQFYQDCKCVESTPGRSLDRAQASSKK